MKIMIPSLDSDDSDSETDVADFASRPLHLATKTYLQRQSFYRQSFAGTIVQLKDFQFPELCDLLPQFAAEIRHVREETSHSEDRSSLTPSCVRRIFLTSPSSSKSGPTTTPRS